MANDHLRQDFIDIFRPQITGIIELIDEQIRDFHNLDKSGPGKERKVEVLASERFELWQSDDLSQSIVLVGGASDSPYLQQAIKTTYDTSDRPRAGYKIFVTIPDPKSWADSPI